MRGANSAISRYCPASQWDRRGSAARRGGRPRPARRPRGPRARTPQRVPSARLHKNRGRRRESPDGPSATARAPLPTDGLPTGPPSAPLPSPLSGRGIPILIPGPPGAARPRQQQLPPHGTCCRPAVAAPRRRLAAVGGRWRRGAVRGAATLPAH